MIRAYQAADFTELRRIHARNGYDVDFNLLTFPHRRVLEVDGKAIGAVLGRLSMQVDLVLDRDGGNPRTAPERWERWLLLQKAGEEYALEMGVKHAHCFVPDSIVKTYGPRLESARFVREVGACYLKELRP
jgi:hypothetical protein